LASKDGGLYPSLKKELPSFETLWKNYPTANEDGSPAHPSADPYENQCAIRLGKALQLSGVDMSSYPSINLTSDGYPRSANNLANWLWRNYGSPQIMSSSTFETKYTNSTGIIYIEGVHIDLWNNGKTGSGFYQGNVMFWPVK
jgi:Type VI secretion system (T6SS), amidase effector protein 4